MTRKNQLRGSGTRLQQQGALWLQQTRNAGGTFVTEAQDASVTFGQDMKAASAKLVRTAGRSAQGFQKALNKEARDWQAVVLQTRDGYMAAAEERRERVERQAVSAREALKPGAVETTVLQSAHGLLELAQSRVDARLEEGAKPAAAKTASKPTAVKVGAKKGQSPMRNYDQLTAKDLVTRVQKLSAPQATAVLDYERGRKKRATVIRAAEQRLSAAS
jgi:hypothetical protein